MKKIQQYEVAFRRAAVHAIPTSGSFSVGMGDNEYSGPCACLLNCFRVWRERESLRRYAEFLRAGEVRNKRPNKAYIRGQQQRHYES